LIKEDLGIGKKKKSIMERIVHFYVMKELGLIHYIKDIKKFCDDLMV